MHHCAVSRWKSTCRNAQWANKNIEIEYLRIAIAEERKIGNPDTELFEAVVDANLINTFQVPRGSIYRGYKIDTMKSQPSKYLYSTKWKNTNE